jgi:hypothetical protein
LPTTDQTTDTWIGIVSDGSIDCQGLSACDGKALWIDGTNFNASYFTTISDIQISSGHRSLHRKEYFTQYLGAQFFKYRKVTACICVYALYRVIFLVLSQGAIARNF